MVGYDRRGRARRGGRGDARDLRLAARWRGYAFRARRPRRRTRGAEGAYIGFLDGDLIAVESGADEAALVLAREIMADGADVLTLLKGEELAEAELERILEGIRELDDDLEVEARDGGQPLYPLQMVAE